MNTKCPLPKGFSGTRRVFGILVGLLVLALMAAPGAGAAPFAYVSNFSSNTVTVIDGTTVLATVPVGEQPAGVAVNPAETRVYVANSNFFQNGVPSVSVINTADFSVTTITANISGQPSSVAVSPDNAIVYVTDTQNGSVFVIDAATNTVVTTLSPPPGEPRQLAAAVVAGGSVYATNMATGEVVNVTNGTMLPVFVSFNMMGIAANSDGSRLFVSNGNDTTDDLEVTVIDTTTNPMSIVLGTPVRISQPGTDAGTQPAGIAVSAGFVYAPILLENALAVLNAADNTIVKTVRPSPGNMPFNQPFGVAADPTGTRVYVGNPGNRTATVLDGATNTVLLSTIAVGMNPMAFGSFVAGARPIPPPPQFVLSLSRAGSGTIAADPLPMAGGKYSVGTPVTLTAMPDAGFAFTGWSGDCSGTSVTCSVVMDRARYVTATFTAQYTLYMTVLGNGTVGQVPMPTAGKYLAGTPVTLTATPAADSLFTGWSGDACSGSTSPSCSVTMDRTKSVTASFALKQFVLTVTKNGTGTGTVTAQPSSTTWTFDIGTTVTLTATPYTGSQFSSWPAGPCSGSTSPSCDVKMDMARSVTATFTLTPPLPPPAPTTCDDKIKDLEKKVAADKHPWRHDHQLKAALRLYSAAQVELGKAKAKVGEHDKRYVRALKEFNNGKAALCSGRYWRAHHELWESYFIAHEVLKHHRR
jgi:uncharacterized repeat protein (TIGR02543 family)